jgi:hypothetical protein
MTVDVPAFRSRVFLCGADMQPSRIRARWSQARFMSIARADGVLAAGLGLGWYGLGPEMWGIIVETGEPQRGAMLPLWLPDGTSVTAMAVDGPEAFGSLAEALAQARYWELPADYRDRLELAAGS